jgi:DNA-binding response OmpR family regulator
MSAEPIKCPDIGSHSVYRDDESRILIVDGRLKRFTRIEYQLLLPLLVGKTVPDTDLVQASFSCSLGVNVKKNLETHIYHIRNKLRSCGIWVSRVTPHGYMLTDVT